MSDTAAASSSPGVGQETDSSTERDRFRDWPRPARWVVYFLIGLVVAALAAALVGRGIARRPLPTTTGSLAEKGLRGTVDVYRDDYGIPQVYADTPTDLFFAQGYVQAQDRFWQMDLRRHVTAGRLSEMFGEATLKADLFLRTMGWHRVAEEEYRLLNPETRAGLDAYAEGVNAWLAEHGRSQRSLEYTALRLVNDGYRPEKWTAVDSLAWLKAMAWDLSGNYRDEIDRARLSVDRTPAQIAELYPAFPYADHPTIVRSDTLARPGVAEPPAYRPAMLRALTKAGHGLDRLPALLGTGDGIGSNAFVVAGEHTTTGAPLLASDPHLDLTMPGTFTQIGLHCRNVGALCDIDVAGFSFAGFPGVIIGHNRDIAWGLTNLKADVIDLYLEKMDGNRYVRGKLLKPVQQRQERIEVAGGRTRTLTVRTTDHGPLLSDVSAELSSVGANAAVGPRAPERGNGYAVALAWTALTPGRTADAVFALNRADDWSSFTRAARQLEVPGQSIVYADQAGNIGYTASGRIPIRRPGVTGQYPAEGWDPAQDWTGKFVPARELPRVLNPVQGYLVAANQPPIGPEYRYRLVDSPDYGYRADRIDTLLREKIRQRSAFRVADLSRIQNDTRNPVAPALVPYLLDVPMPSGYYSDGQRLLADWDFTQPADSGAAAYFNAVWRNLLKEVYGDQLRESLLPDGSSRWTYVTSQLLRQPDSPWWDDTETKGVVEDRDMILARVMRAARDELVRRHARDPRKWTWGHLHRLELHSQIGDSDKLLGMIFNSDVAGTPGGSGAVNATGWDPRQGYTVTSGPVVRMVVDLAEPDRSGWVSLAGISGHTASLHYTDQREAWLSGTLLPWRFRPAEGDHLVLKPRD